MESPQDPRVHQLSQAWPWDQGQLPLTDPAVYEANQDPKHSPETREVWRMGPDLVRSPNVQKAQEKYRYAPAQRRQDQAQPGADHSEHLLELKPRERGRRRGLSSDSVEVTGP